MSANIICPTCGKQFRLKEELLGRKVRCTACKEPFIAEADIELAPAPVFHDETPRYATSSPAPRSSQLTSRQQSELEAALKAIASRAGWQFALLGVLGLGLPYIGLQLRILHGMSAATPTVATCMAGIGGFLWFAGNSAWGGPLLCKVNVFGLGSTKSGANPSVQRIGRYFQTTVRVFFLGLLTILLMVVSYGLYLNFAKPHPNYSSVGTPQNGSYSPQPNGHPRNARVADPSPEKKVLIDFLIALGTGDAKTMKNNSYGCDSRFLDAIARVAGSKREVEAAAQRFSGSFDDVPKPPGTVEQFRKDLATMPELERVGATARSRPISGKVIMLALDMHWRVDAPTAIDIPPPDKINGIIDGLLEQAMASEEIAKQIRAGTYSDWAAAKKAWSDRTMSALVVSLRQNNRTAPTRTQVPAQTPARAPAQIPTPIQNKFAITPPSETDSAAKLKKIETTWHPVRSTPVDLLGKMKFDDAERGTDGIVRIHDWGTVVTLDSFKPPMTFRMIVMMNNNDIRISYSADQIIFNWEMGPDELRVDGVPASGKFKPGAGRLTANQWVGIEFITQNNEMVIFVDGIERYRVQADFSHIDRPFRLQSHVGELWVKSVMASKF